MGCCSRVFSAQVVWSWPRARGFWSHVKPVATANPLASVVLLPALLAPLVICRLE